MQTHAIKQRVQINVSFAKATVNKIRAKSKELGVTQSRLINTIVHNALAMTVAAKPAVKKAAK